MPGGGNVDSHLSRRDFVKLGAVAAAVGAVAPRVLAQQAEEQAAQPQLEYRTLGKTGLKVTTASFGCMLSPEEIIARAVDAGVNWLDTAHTYRGGRNEYDVGRVVKGRRDKVYIATKTKKGSAAEMIGRLDISLERLQTDHVDLFMTHGVSKVADVTNEDYIDALQQAKKSGKTRLIGVTTHSNMPAVIDALVDAKVYDCVLTRFDFKSANPDTPGGKALKDAVARAAAAGIGVIAMKTQVGGFENPMGGLTPHQAALKWVLDNENISCAVAGAQNFTQLEQNLAVMGHRLGYLERRRLEKYAAETASLYCTGCSFCDGTCPDGVSIPDVRRCAMYMDGYHEPQLARETYREIPTNASPCQDCESCTARCVQGTALQPIMRDAHSRLA
jgi:hypothetical protein